MTTEKKYRTMSAKGFLTKSNSHKALTSALGFLAVHKEYLLTGEISYATVPIVARFDSGEIIGSVALDEIKRAVLDHIQKVAVLAAEESLEKAQEKVQKTNKEPKAPKSKKSFEAMILDAATGEIAQRVKDNGEIESLVKGFDMPQDCERWVDRRLFDGCPSWYGVVTHKKAIFAEHAVDIIERGDSIARILKKPGKPVMKQHTKTSSSLGFGVKVRESATRFSHG
jgi:hypothetical protein